MSQQDYVFDKDELADKMVSFMQRYNLVHMTARDILGNKVTVVKNIKHGFFNVKCEIREDRYD